jgi:molecular chaperone GrpE
MTAEHEDADKGVADAEIGGEVGEDTPGLDAFDEFLTELEEAEVGGAEQAPETELAAAIRERDSFKDMALRLQADFENYRKRVAAQKTDDIERAAGKLVETLLPVLDACEAAFAHGAEGVEPIWSQLMGVLQKQGLEALDLAEKPFDPTLADAVMHEPGDGPEPIVSDVLRTGYMWKGRVLRAAMVKVRG